VHVIEAELRGRERGVQSVVGDQQERAKRIGRVSKQEAVDAEVAALIHFALEEDREVVVGACAADVSVNEDAHEVARAHDVQRVEQLSAREVTKILARLFRNADQNAVGSAESAANRPARTLHRPLQSVSALLFD